MSLWTDEAAYRIAVGTLNLSTDVLKLMLVNASHTPVKTDIFVSGIVSSEIAATGYVGGFAGAGRQAAPRTITKDVTANKARVIFNADAAFGALGGALNDTVVGAWLIKESTSDANSLLVAFLGLATAIPTNGSTFTLTRDATNGNLTLSVI